MFDQNSFGHFGAPDQLNANYGSSYGSNNDLFPPESDVSDERYSEAPPFIQNGKPLPPVKDGATDQQVNNAVGIVGLISEIQKKMGSAITGQLDGAAVKSYQQSKGLIADGIVGPQSYKALGFQPPFQGSDPTSVSGQISPKGLNEVGVIGKPFYKRGSFWLYSVGGIIAAYSLYSIFSTDDEE